MANANVRASFNINANAQYKSDTGSSNTPMGLGPRIVSLDPATVTKSYPVVSVTIDPALSYTLDLASFVDSLNVAVSWSNLFFILIEHNSASLATAGIDFTGAAGNAIPSLRGSSLIPGEGCVPYYCQSTGAADPTAGKAFTGPNSRIVIQNLDAANPAIIDILLMGA